MVSSTCQAIACVLLFMGIAAQAQTASISGKVTIKGKGAGGIVVVVSQDKYSGGWERSRNRATSDADGNYRIANLPAGNYYVSTLAPAFVIEKEQSRPLLVVAAGENLRDVDFALVRGGVITGKITDWEGQPLIELHVDVMAVEFHEDGSQLGNLQTDDRGIYRAFGLRPGKYKVSVGQPARGLPGQFHNQTFYPSVTDIEKATVIEVTAGGEVSDVDIVMSKPSSSYTVTGRVIDGDTGLPVTAFRLGIQQKDENSSSSTTGGERFNKDGQFKLENVMPGRYTVFILPPSKSEWRADPITFNVIDKDLSGLEIRTKKGASISGVVVLESSIQKSRAAKLSDVIIYPRVVQNRLNQYEGMQATAVGPDGSFTITGLAAGTVQFTVTGPYAFKNSQFELGRVEHNGVLQPEGTINVKDGEQVSGVRLFVKQMNLTGSVRGQIKIEDGELSPASRLVVLINPVSESQSKPQFRSSSNSPEVDARGRFLLEGLAAGEYEVTVMMFQPGAATGQAKQQVTVIDNTVTDVILTLKIKP